MGSFIPYGRQAIDHQDIEAVVGVLGSDWLTTGPQVEGFERDFSAEVGTDHAVAVSSGTAALHAAMFAIDVGEGDEVIVPAMTFAASANCVVYQGATPVFCDVDPDTLLIDPDQVKQKITPRTRAVVAVDYAGQPCDYDALRQIATKHNITLIADACHSVGATYQGRPVGSLADLSAFSFHPVKHFTTGEGGMITTDDETLAQRMRSFRNHGIETDHRQRAQRGTWYYEMTQLGYNYRITDFQCALGRSQLKKLPGWIQRRQEIARRYDEAFAGSHTLHPLATHDDRTHAYHLYVIRLDPNGPTGRQEVFEHMRDAGIGVNVHYLPVHLHPFYRDRFKTTPGLCPESEAAYEQILSLPMYPGLTDEQLQTIIDTLSRKIGAML